MSNPNKATETDAGYDAVAVDYAARTLTRSAEVEEFRSRFLSELAPNSVIIDLGCGSGTDIDYFDQAGHQGIALDRSMGLLQLGNSRRNVRADLRNIPVADASADALWSHASLLHIEPEALAETFEEWQRILRAGGVVAFVTSLGGDSGWELAPAASPRIPEMASGGRRWFVHHQDDFLLDQMQQRGWDLIEVSQRRSHRDWILAIARVPGEIGTR